MHEERIQINAPILSPLFEEADQMTFINKSGATTISDSTRIKIGPIIIFRAIEVIILGGTIIIIR